MISHYCFENTCFIYNQIIRCAYIDGLASQQFLINCDLELGNEFSLTLQIRVGKEIYRLNFTFFLVLPYFIKFLCWKVVQSKRNVIFNYKEKDLKFTLIALIVEPFYSALIHF